MIFFKYKLSTKNRKQVNKQNSFLLPSIISTVCKQVMSAWQTCFFKTCVCCQTSTSHHILICDLCLKDLRVAMQQPLCDRCKIPIIVESDNDWCVDCRKNEPAFDACTVVTEFQFPASSLVHALKYGKKQYYARLFGHLLCEERKKSCLPLPDFVCSIPMHKNKQNKKGFNHAEEIARHCATELALNFEPKMLNKNQATESQSTLGRAERFKNLSNSISVHPDLDINAKHIAIIDDVMTTGATFEYAARVLKARGAAHVEVWAFARTPKDRQHNSA